MGVQVVEGGRAQGGRQGGTFSLAACAALASSMTRMKAARLPLATTSGRASRISARDAKAVAPGTLLAPAAPRRALAGGRARARALAGGRGGASSVGGAARHHVRGSAMAGSS